ncbi:hypothetical protein CCACVL1_17374 [Corchorus capsularis]|uniref:C2H2-type domain-containing protein n=1 Tax=Corchorus capsularis TaxID=210143 RepID=A0A1R3HSS4_COCAP|nr:hypothetical protein CCACVL1_17374 [Corchorus capsularis]
MEKYSGKGKEKENMYFQGYGLRDNPKKSWKSSGFVDGSSSSAVMFSCKVCGKEFEAMKALFGHMRHHSKKETKGRFACKECGKKFQSLRALTGHMRLHSVKLRASESPRKDLVLESKTVRRKRSKRPRYSNTPNSSFSSLNASSGVVEIEIDEELEYVALCLMMLSKGVRNGIEFNSFDDNPDSSEIKSSYQNKEIMEINENDDPFCDGNEFFQVKKPRVYKSDSDVSDSVNVSFENEISGCKELDFGIVAYNEKKVGTKVDVESGFELYDAEIEERISGEVITLGSIEVESGQVLIKGMGLAGLGATEIELSSCKDAMYDACDAETGGDSLNKLICVPFNSKMSDDFLKKNKYKCKICNKSFKSHRALGGHQTFHRKMNNCAVEQTENCDNNTQGSSAPETDSGLKLVKVDYAKNPLQQEMTGVTDYGTRVYKVHRCQICSKVFASGQALGGHKRCHTHISKESESRDRQLKKQLEFADICDAMDLNHPFIHTEEANGDVGFMACRVGSDCKREALLSLVAN